MHLIAYRNNLVTKQEFFMQPSSKFYSHPSKRPSSKQHEQEPVKTYRPTFCNNNELPNDTSSLNQGKGSHVQTATVLQTAGRKIRTYCQR
jgi:hypothetical protein